MTLPKKDVARVERWSARRMPEYLRDQMRVECDVADRHITIYEARAPWADEPPDGEWTRLSVARLRYTKVRNEWTLYWPDSDSRFHLWKDFDARRSVQSLLDFIDDDPTGIFWG